MNCTASDNNKAIMATQWELQQKQPAACSVDLSKTNAETSSYQSKSLLNRFSVSLQQQWKCPQDVSLRLSCSQFYRRAPVPPVREGGGLSGEERLQGRMMMQPAGRGRYWRDCSKSPRRFTEEICIIRNNFI